MRNGREMMKVTVEEGTVTPKCLHGTLGPPCIVHTPTTLRLFTLQTRLNLHQSPHMTSNSIQGSTCSLFPDSSLAR